MNSLAMQKLLPEMDRPNDRKYSLEKITYVLRIIFIENTLTHTAKYNINRSVSTNVRDSRRILLLPSSEFKQID